MILSTGVIIVRKEAGPWQGLFLRAYRNWDFPKGMVEAGETPLQAAIREASEETGIGPLEFRWGHRYRETRAYGKKIARYYIAVTDQSTVALRVNPEIGRPEHHEYRWADFDDLRRLAPDRLRPIIDWAEELIGSRATEAKGTSQP